MGHRMGFIKKITVNIFLSFFSIFIFLFITELVLIRVFPVYKESPGPDSSYEITTQLYKITVRTNSLNIRDREIPPKEKNEFRILCLGDSFTFGLGVEVEDTYTRLLENLLNKDRKRSCVINAGGGDPYDFLVDRGLALKPDLVLLQIYIGNDFYDRMSSIDPEVMSSVEMSRLIYGKIISRATLNLVLSRLRQIRKTEEILFYLDSKYSYMGIFLNEYPRLERLLAESEQGYLRKIFDLCNNNGIQMLVLVVPWDMQFRKKYLMSSERYNYRKPNEILKTFFRKNNMTYIDLLDYYEKMPVEEAETLYYKRDIHWTKEGHRHAAEILAPVIKDMSD